MAASPAMVSGPEDSARVGANVAWRLQVYRGAAPNLLVVGGTAGERLRVAQRFHSEGPLRLGPLVPVDAARDQGRLVRALEEWLTDAPDARGNPLRAAERGTLFVDALECLGAASQRLLLAYVLRRDSDAGHGEPDAWTGRLIAGAGHGILEALSEGRFDWALFDAIDKIRVDLARPRAGAA